MEIDRIKGGSGDERKEAKRNGLGRAAVAGLAGAGDGGGVWRGGGGDAVGGGMGGGDWGGGEGAAA